MGGRPVPLEQLSARRGLSVVMTPCGGYSEGHLTPGSGGHRGRRPVASRTLGRHSPRRCTHHRHRSSAPEPLRKPDHRSRAGRRWCSACTTWSRPQVARSAPRGAGRPDPRPSELRPARDDAEARTGLSDRHLRRIPGRHRRLRLQPSVPEVPPRMGGFLLTSIGPAPTTSWPTKTSAATPTPRPAKRPCAAFRRRWAIASTSGRSGTRPTYRPSAGDPRDLVRLTFVAAKVFGRSRVASPSWCPCAATNPEGLSGAWVGGRYLTRGEFIDSYWRILLAQSRRRGVPLPLSVISIHAYGLGPTVGDAVRDRLMKIRTFKVNTRSILGRRMRQLELWDTEWNLRRAWPTLPKGTPASPTRRRTRGPGNVRCGRRPVPVWIVSTSTGGSVDRPLRTNREYLNLPLNDRARWMTAAFRQLAGRSVRCTWSLGFGPTPAGSDVGFWAARTCSSPSHR